MALVAIIGRPNVGKSTLFNRLIGRRQAIVDEYSGVTRDRHYGKSDWGGREFSVIDTGGYVSDTEDQFEKEIAKQVFIAMEEASLIIFVCDARAGLNDLDKDVANILRQSKKPVLLAANKVDNPSMMTGSYEFYELGFEKVYPISAVNGTGTGDMLDDLIQLLPEEIDEDGLELPRISVVGRPNAGKSSLVNALLGIERNIVTEIAGTTRDTIDTNYNAFDMEFTLVDTAGIRKKAKVHEDLEFYSVMRAIRAIENSDVCILMIDAEAGLGQQDLNIYGLIEKNRKGVVVLVNKWDLMEKDSNTSKEFEAELRKKLAPFNDVPIIFTSVLTKQRIHKSLQEALEVYKNRTQRIKTAKLNEILLPIIEHTPPPALKGKYIKIKYIQQLPTHAPTFAFYCNLPQYIKEAYRRFLENQMRRHFNFTGVPIQIFFRKK
ncbi:MAG: ribosome biogenesis GTPase Der [Flavobacteriales bacterium]|jgi:GTP-binding protein|nr:ribosome biogenesis GTPase Der [Flavobacteriales bacterium]MBT4705061.1 ribosome biogenesis GTPase Der [Flavobacteriales bacterium]MBT4930081.1 ribosome biogenesis GTPase Der [Flavobacteriales bacterium]MBT5133039.1 ribosome biogenesis GTPase Der [Flavobacteriales bacterium]MBT6131948.1 ribosome biogenesis GTPase Der [Flavobacteriales bacterium]